MWTRWHTFGDVRNQMQRLHDDMNRLFGRHAVGNRDLGQGVYPTLNLFEDDNNLYVEAELPGFGADDVEMYVNSENQLNIKGQRKPPEHKSGTWHRQERGFGSFTRTVELPGAVDGDNVSAAFADGVLTITLPKRQKAKPRRIDVKSN